MINYKWYNVKLYERVFKTPKETTDLLNWGEIGRKQIKELKKQNILDL